MTKDEALRLALEVLADLGMKHYENTGEVLYKNTYTAIKAALEAKDEPVAWFWFDERDGGEWIHIADNQINADKFGNAKVIPLYTTPPQRIWVGLTDKDWNRSKHNQDFQKGVDWAEEMLKGKNT